MADKYIPELDLKTSLLNTDIFPVDDGQASYKVPLSMIISAIPGVTNVAINQTGDGIVITFRDGSTANITTHDTTKQNVLTFDSVPTDGSTNPVTSDGIHDALGDVSDLVDTEAGRASQAESDLGDEITQVKNEIGNVESGLTATHKYIKGEYFYVGNDLKIAMTDIAVGETLASGNNYTNASTAVLTLLRDMARLAVVSNANEDSLTATYAHNEGSIFVINCTVTGGGSTLAPYLLWRATADIDIGDTITYGTNIEQVTIEELIAEKQDALTFDNEPTEDSVNPVTSDGIYTAIESVQNALDDLGLYVDAEGYLCQSIN